MSDNRGGNQFQRDPNRTALVERVDTDVLAAMGAIDGSGNALRTNFLPTSFIEAMELAKLMASGTFVPERIRGKPGDALAIVMQATRWGMDPFAVAQKVYFVNSSGIPGYEAQLIVAVLNTSGAIEGTLDVRWEGEGDTLKCFVEGKRRGSRDVKKVEQEIKTIKTKNSPLWVQSPRQQLAYYTQRLWGRLYAPEVMLGVYAADELVGADGEQARRIGGDSAPAAPTRTQIAERVIQNEPVKPREDAYDQTTGEVIDQESEEEIQRRLDAEQDARDNGTIDDAVDEGEDEDEQDAGPAAETVEQASAKVEPEAAKVEEPAKPAEQDINWEAWLAKYDKDLAALSTVEAVNKLSESKAARLADASDGIKNRARGYHRARLRQLETPVDKPNEPAKKPTAAQKRAEAAAASVEEQKPAENPAPAQEEQTDVADPRTARADAIIAEFNRKEMLVDLRSYKASVDADIDAMDDENGARVTRAFRAVEDRLKGPKK